MNTSVLIQLREKLLRHRDKGAKEKRYVIESLENGEREYSNKTNKAIEYRKG